jgi:hypothetical protein
MQVVKSPDGSRLQIRVSKFPDLGASKEQCSPHYTRECNSLYFTSLFRVSCDLRREFHTVCFFLHTQKKKVIVIIDIIVDPESQSV